MKIVTLLIAALSAAGLLTAAHALRPPPCTVLIAHEGYHWPYAEYPENSLAALAGAAGHGAGWVETDVAMSRDGRPVIMHGGSEFAFVTGRRGRPGDYTFAQLTAMRLRTHPGGGFLAGRVPSMAAYLAQARAYRLRVEIEASPSWTTAQFRAYIRVLRAAGAAAFARVSGTSPANLAAVRRAYPGIRTDLLAASFWPAPPTARGSVMEDLEVSYATPARAAALARQHTALDIWTPDTRAAMRRALALHPALVTTDNLGLFRAMTGC